MLDIDLRHPVFSDFKDIKLNATTTLCFPPGCGGNFLADVMMDPSARPIHPHSNEYMATAMALPLDVNIISPDYDGSMRLVATWHDLIYRARMLRDRISWYGDPIDMVISHAMPYLTDLITDYRTNELIVITLRPQHAWIPYALINIKHLLDRDYNNKPWLIQTLLQNCPMGKIVNWSDYESMLHILDAAGLGLDLAHTPLSWHWYMSCNSLSMKSGNIDQFKLFATNKIFGDTVSLDGWHRLNTGEYLDWCIDHFRTKGLTVITVDYVELFFAQRLPPTGRLAQIPKDRISQYCMQNIKIIADVANNLSPEIMQRLSDLINEFGLHIGQDI